jgi:hypothetical protein
MTLISVSDKEKEVMKLLKGYKNYQEIANEAHVSFTSISKVNKKRVREDPSIKKLLSIPTSFEVLFLRKIRYRSSYYP